MNKKLFTSESVGAGHPDKICDQISDTILDAVLKGDENSRVAVEVMASNRLIIIGGEITTKTYVDFVKCAWEVLFVLGYSENDFTVISNINSQSPDINQGVDLANGKIGAGDQGIMFGYANEETPELMPLPITLSHRLVAKAEEDRLSGKFKWAGSDMKSQVTINYESGKPVVDTVLMSIQHKEEFNEKEFKEYISKEIIQKVLDKYEVDSSNYQVLINPTGKFVIGGPVGDTGLTGRKIIVDTYGGMGRHGGGAFSGKDYTKVDRSAAYAARWVAKHIVAAKLAKEVEIQLSYAIGLPDPISISINTFGTETISIDKIESAVRKTFDLSLDGIINKLGLKKPIYKQTATFGHFGRPDLNLPWEKLNMLKELKANV
ncbi:MAG: methionine adenosyltransferase [Mycoplasmataceae bacterium]|nr:methionine adenosyltransferase [Mycoplasmataceae bacterium]